MITKIKKSVSLSNSLLKELALFNKDENISQFIETALAYYIKELKNMNVDNGIWNNLNYY